MLDTNAVNSNPNLVRGVMRLFGPLGSHDFGIYVNGTIRPDVNNPNINSVTTNYTYKSLSDDGHMLREEGSLNEKLIWTTPDGAELTYVRPTTGTIIAATGAALIEVSYPNGFRLYKSIIGSSVQTNTGFMLRRFTSSVNSNLSPAKQQVYSSLAVKPHTPSSSEWTKNTGSVVGVNLAYERCHLTSTCSLSMSWPTAS